MHRDDVAVGPAGDLLQARQRDRHQFGVALVRVAPAATAAGYQRAFKKDVGPLVEAARKLAASDPKAMMKPVDILYCAGTAATAERP